MSVSVVKEPVSVLSETLSLESVMILQCADDDGERLVQRIAVFMWFRSLVQAKYRLKRNETCVRARTTLVAGPQ